MEIDPTRFCQERDHWPHWLGMREKNQKVCAACAAQVPPDWFAEAQSRMKAPQQPPPTSDDKATGPKK